MKTLIFFGSPRKKGDTASLLDIFLKNLDGEHMIIDCYNVDISPCVDCRFCRSSSGCVRKDEMQQVYGYITDCDNILIASPIYFNQLTGRLLDVCSRFQTYFSARFFRKEIPDINPKKGGVILTGGGNGDPVKAYDTAVCLLREVNAKEIFPLVCSHNTDKIPAANDTDAVSDIFKLADFFNG